MVRITVAALWLLLNCGLCLVDFPCPLSSCRADQEHGQQQRAAGDLNLLPGFQAERVYKVPRDEQGSWVSLTVDPEGRLIASSQWGQLYRITPPPKQSGLEAKVEKIDLAVGQAQGLLYAFDSLYVVVNGATAQGSGLYRVRDTDGDDQYDEVRLLRRIEGSGEHGPHGIVLSPDGKSLYVVGGNNTEIPNPEKSRVPRHWGEDLILSPQNDPRGFGASIRAPGGWVCRTDPEGREWELIATGFRNAYDLAFNQNGDLFTYDSDNEWDMGMPWYRPTRVCHVVSGGEFGWRTGSGKWPAYQPDSLPAAVEIGPGSPTGIAFGSGSQFPEKYRRALFLSDWSFGNLYAVHLTPRGASYDGIAEPFVTAAPLPITDLVVRPQDGMLYFTVGGRGVESALYRVWYAANQAEREAPPPSVGDVPPAEIRRRLETLHQPGADLREAAKIVERAWPQLGHPDRHVRFAARIALEHQPLVLWQERTIRETNPQILIHAAIGLTRSWDGHDADGHDADWQAKLIAALVRIDWSALSEEDRIGLVRAYQLALIRLGPPSESLRKKLIDRLGPLYPAESPSLNRELCGLLVALRGPDVISKTLELVRNARTQEEQIHYMFCLRLLSEGWKMSERAEYFEWFKRADEYRGGVSFDSFTDQIRKEASKTLSAEEKQALVDLLADRRVTSLPAAAANRTLVRNWTVDDLIGPASEHTAGRDLVRGEALFAAASCFRCHRMAGRGGTTGPDLTGAGRRFTVRDLLEAIVEPNRVISDQYRSTVFTLSDGKTLTGHIADMKQGELSVITDMLRPRDYTQINRDEIEEMGPSPVSMMPAGLLDTLSLEEILDLLAYLRAGAERSDPSITPAED